MPARYREAVTYLAGAGTSAVGGYTGGPIADFITTNVPEIPGLGYVLLFAIYRILFVLSAVALAHIKKTSKAT